MVFIVSVWNRCGSPGLLGDGRKLESLMVDPPIHTVMYEPFWGPAHAADYAARRSFVVSAARRRRAPLDSNIATTTTRNPMTDRVPATGAVCVSSRR